MQLPFNIDYLLTSGRVESERLEFKEAWNPLKVMHTLCAFANDISKIMRAVRHNGSPRPNFETDPDRTYFAATFPIHPKAQAAQAEAREAQEAKAESGTPPVTPPVAAGPESRPESGPESVMARRVVAILASGSRSRNEIAVELGHKGISGASKRAINDLRQQAMIEYTIPDKPNSRLQKYRLTAEGRAWLEKESPVKDHRGITT